MAKMFKKALAILLLAIVAVFSFSCKEQEPINTPEQSIDDVPNPVVEPADKEGEGETEDPDENGEGEASNANLAEYEYFVVRSDGKWALKEDKINADTMIAAACELYYYANRNYQNTSRAYAYSTCVTKPLGSSLLEAKTAEFEIKNGDEYLKYKVQGKSIGNEPYTEAIYTRVGLDRSYYVKTKKGSIDKNWTVKPAFSSPTISQLDKATDEIFFNIAQEPKYCAAGAVIVPETVSSATIEYSQEDSCYTLVFELDVSNAKTTEVILPQMKQNSGDDGAHYNSITETFEIWDTGMFKHFRSIDNAHAKVDLNINYNSYFSYGEQDCDMASYFNNYYETIKTLCEEANASAE